MLAAVFEGLGSPLSIRSVPDPEPLANELLLRVRACGVCGTDIHLANEERAVFGETLLPGSILGHEFAGEVVAIGGHVTDKWREGDRVAAFPVFACGACGACRSGRPVSCGEASFIGLGSAQGAYAQYARIPAALAMPLPGNVGFAAGAVAEPLAVGLRATELAMPLRGASVLIIGAGPIGLLISALCRHFGARDIIVADLVAERAARGVELGASAWIDASRDDVRRTFRALAGRHPTIVFDAAGGVNGLENAMACAGRDAKVVVVAPHHDPSPVSTMTGFLKELTIGFAKAYTVDDYRAALQLLETGAIDPAPLITDIVGLEDFPTLFQSLRSPSGKAKVILDPFLKSGST